MAFAGREVKQNQENLPLNNIYKKMPLVATEARQGLSMEVANIALVWFSAISILLDSTLIDGQSDIFVK